MWAGVNDYPEPEPDPRRDRIEAKIEQLRDEYQRLEDDDSRRLWASLIQMYERGWYDSIKN